MNGTADQVPETAVCLQCGYSLRGLRDLVCPECGQPFDPADTATFADPNRWRFRLRFARPPQRWHRRVVLLVTLLVLLDSSSPGDLVSATCIFTPLAFVLLVVVLADYVLRVIVVRLEQSRGLPWRERQDIAAEWRWHWLVTPLCFLLMVSVLWYPWSAWVRFHLSRPALERVVKSGTTTQPYQLVGLYVVRRVNRYGNNVVFFDMGDRFLDKAGIMYRPTARPIQDAELYPVHRLGASWYTAILSW